MPLTMMAKGAMVAMRQRKRSFVTKKPFASAFASTFAIVNISDEPPVLFETFTSSSPLFVVILVCLNNTREGGLRWVIHCEESMDYDSYSSLEGGRGEKEKRCRTRIGNPDLGQEIVYM